MSPDVWGPYIWFALHFIALAYPQDPTTDDVVTYKYFFENFWRVLPCHKCSLNYQRHLHELPLTETDLACPDALFAWTVALHNIVNKEKNKATWTVEQAKAFYTSSTFHARVAERYGGSQKYVTVATTAATATPPRHESLNIMSAVIGAFIGVLLTFMALLLMTKARRR